VARLSTATGAVTAKIKVGMKSVGVGVANNTLWVVHPYGTAVAGSNLFAGAVTRVNL
jgi:hypothetical protein